MKEDIKSLIKASQTNPMGALLKTEFDKMLIKWNDRKDDRVGLHASSIIASDSDFCYREQILSFHYKKNDIFLSPRTLAVFLNGWYVHIKWQTLFEQMGVLNSAELTRKSDMWNVYMTPDADINLLRKRWIVEIKSMNMFQFKHLKGPPINAVRQCQFYMHNLCVPNGLILVEDKNTQEFEIWPIEYDPTIARPFIERLYKIKRCEKKFNEEGKLPIGICSTSSVKRAQNCCSSKACFADKQKREKMMIK